MANQSPLVSIAMPVHNNQKTLIPAIKSILYQTYPCWNLLLVNDGSTDESMKIMNEFAEKDDRIKVWSDGNKLGLPARLNQTIENSCGEFYARMDGDDIAYPQRISCQVEYMINNPNVDLVGAQVIIFRGDGVLLGKRSFSENHLAITANPINGFPIAHPTFFGRISFFNYFKYNTLAITCEDQDLLLRSYRYCTFGNIPRILLGYREERIDLKKILIGRHNYIKCLIRELNKNKHYSKISIAIAFQIFKSLVDIVAVYSRLNYRLLKHRAQPTTLDELHNWNKVWSQVQGSR